MTFEEAFTAAFGSQARLAVWLPLLGYLAWLVLSRRFGVTSPRARFLGLLALTLLPALVFIWPFATTLGRGALMNQSDVSRFFDLPQRFANGRATWWISLVYLWPYFIIPLGMLGAVLTGAVEYLWARVRLLLLRKSRRPGVTILEAPGLGAFTFGLLRPRVFISRAAWDGPHRDAILAHERAHARCFDPLWLFIARGIRRSTLYLPFGAAIYQDLLLESERACDAAGARRLAASATLKRSLTMPRRARVQTARKQYWRRRPLLPSGRARLL